MDPEDRVEGIAFDPVALGRRRRGFEPAVLGAVVIALGLVTAAFKPWAGSAPASPVPAVSSPLAVVASVAPSLRVDRAPLTFAPSPAMILVAIDPHHAWGVRAVVRSPLDPADGDALELTERWAPAVVQDDGSRLAVLGTGGQVVVALGVTAPLDKTPLDVRIWRPSASGDWELLAARVVSGDTPDADLLLTPPANDPIARETWPAGYYRIELVAGARVRIIDVGLPGRFERIQVPPRSALPALEGTAPAP